MEERKAKARRKRTRRRLVIFRAKVKAIRKRARRRLVVLESLAKAEGREHGEG